MTASPCVRNCCLNEDDICLGCFRSLAEIVAWNEADAAKRRAILDHAKRRRRAHEMKSKNPF
ncbi:MAG: DUF1289 domain-containing protein [Burkholderiales bacterium]